MSQGEGAASGAAKRPGRRRLGEIAFVVVLGLLIAAAAWYQEEIHYFFALQAWNPGQPAHTVVSFLRAGRAGNESAADPYLDVNLFHPLVEHGKFVGYEVGTTVGNLEYRFSELAGTGEIRPSRSELVFKGNGAAMVTVPDARARPIAYRLEMQGGAWKITEIRGGRLRR